MFPGQGSQAPGIGRAWRDRPEWDLVAEAEEVTGVNLAHLLLDAGPDELAATDRAQLQVLTASLMAWRAVKSEIGPMVVGFAGHSLGQVTALIAAGAVSFADGLRLAAARAVATRAAQDAQPGGLVALLGADESLAAQACSAAPGRSWVANVNGASQVVIGGEVAVLATVAARARELGARRALVLDVGGAFHTPLMTPAADALTPVLESISFRAPTRPVVTNHNAEPVSSAEGWPDRMRVQLTEPVRWSDCVATLVAIGADTFVEVGPGTTLTGLARRMVPDVTLRSVATPADVLMGSRA